MRYVRLRAFRSTPLLVAGALLASCHEDASRAPPELEAISAQVPEVASMVERARGTAPVRTASGFTLTSIATPRAVDGWVIDARAISLAFDAESGALALTSARHRGIAATPLDGGARHASVEGPALIERDAAGAARSIALPRETGVEHLLVQTDAGTPVGYVLDLPVAWSVRQPSGSDRTFEIRDASGQSRARLVADAAWDREGSRVALEARLDGRRLLLSAPAGAAYPVTIDPEWQDTSTPSKVRARSTATQLADGRTLVIGGISGNDDVLSSVADVLCTTELYDPSTRVWEAGPPVQDPTDEACTPLMDHVATPLPDGSVLITGGANRAYLVGANQPAALAAAWLFDPRARSFTRVGPMVEARVHHTATLLGSGQVLIVGGSDRQTPLQEAANGCPAVDGASCERCVGKASAELYDPASHSFTRIDMPIPRSCHTATLLDEQTVLLIGGGADAVDLAAGRTGRAVGELTIYRDGAFRELPTRLLSPRFGHVAVLRPDRDEIFVGFGRDQATMIQTPKVVAELLDVKALLSDVPPATAVDLCPPETDDAPDDEGDGGGGEGGQGEQGEAGGAGGSTGGDGGATSSSGAGGGGTPSQPLACVTPRAYAAAVLSRSGRALVVGGQGYGATGTRASDVVDAFDFATRSFVSPRPPQLASPSSKPVLTMLPTGKLMVVGRTAPAELLDDTSWRFSSQTTAMAQPRSWHRATLLPDGNILVTGGYSGVSGAEAGVASTRDSAEIFGPATRTATLLAAPMTSHRMAHTATLLPAADGRGVRVLLTGGMTSYKTNDVADYIATDTAELYDPDTQSFTPTGSMTAARAYHTATRLRDGRVLIVAGSTTRRELLPPSAEIYDRVTGSFTAIAPPSVPRLVHTATLLPDGKVLIAGGFAAWGNLEDPAGELASAEIFDPVTQTFRPIEGLVVPRGYQTATTLPSGEVLIAGGTAVTRSAEIFDPSTEHFRPTLGNMNALRVDHLATMLPSGKVLLSGGAEASVGIDPRGDAELFDPVSEQFELLAASASAVGRWDHVSVLLPDGRIALLGGTTDGYGSDATASGVIVEPVGTIVGPGAMLVGAPLGAQPGSAYPIAGTSLTAYWETSSGPYASPTGQPIAVWVPAEGTPVVGTFAPWSTAGATWTPGSTPYAGPGLLFATRHGQTSSGVPVELALAPQGVACRGDAACASGFCSDGVCCNERCHVSGDDDALCRSCSVAMGAQQDGVCAVVAEDTDPHEDCESAAQCAARFGVCGGDGRCEPCVCESKLDCAPGYDCTADGDCKVASDDERADDGCSIGEGSPARPGWSFFALFSAGSLAFARRRRSLRGASTHLGSGRAPAARGAQKPSSPERSVMRVEQPVARKSPRGGSEILKGR